jgi:Lrp/AsnC family transcriptional regulator, leucine-responsive regulatory protein
MTAQYTDIDDIDTSILDALQHDSSVANAELATRVGLSPSACLARVKRLRERGIIRQFTAVVDEQSVGLGAVTFTFVTLSKHSRKAAESFLEKIRRIPQVMECYNITGRADYLLKIVAPDISAYRDFVFDALIEIPEVENIETLIVLKTDKRSLNLPLGASSVGRKK